MTILTEPGEFKHTIRAIAFTAHPTKGNIVADVLLGDTCKPLGDRIRSLVASKLGDDWTVLDWYPAQGEF